MSKYPVDSDWSDDDPRWSRSSIYDGAEDEDVPAGSVGARSVWTVPLPQADRRDLLDARPWRNAEAALAAELARAAQAVGRLDEAVRGRGEAAVQRLAYREVEAMSRAEGLWLDRDRIGLSVLEAGGDPDRARDLGRARWALRRLWAAPDVETDLRRFLGLHERERRKDDGRPDPNLPNLRPVGETFDAAATDWQGALDRLGPVHPFTAALYGMRLWRLAGISATADVIEAATFAARSAAAENRALPFLCLAPRGLSWGRGGPARDHLALWLDEIRDGALTSLAELDRIALWQQQATARTSDLGGRAPGRLIAALAARPYATTADLAEAAALSRDTAERLLPKLQDRGLVREITGRGRYRLWAV